MDAGFPHLTEDLLEEPLEGESHEVTHPQPGEIPILLTTPSAALLPPAPEAKRNRRRRVPRRGVRWWQHALLLCPVVLLAGGWLLASWWWNTSATVTLSPSIHQIDASFLFTASQIQVEALPPVLLRQQITIPTTGTGSQPAAAALGTLTLYNSGLHALVVPEGLVLTGRSGVAVRTLAGVWVPAARYPTFGTASVQAQALEVGPAGNLPADDLYGAISGYQTLSVQNQSFSGGTFALTYRMVTSHDHESALATLTSTMQTSLQGAEEVLLHQGERLLSLSCTWQSQTDHAIGTAATTLTLTLTATCQASRYNLGMLQEALASDFPRSPGTALRSLSIHSLIQTPDQTFLVRASALSVAQWSEEQLHHLKHRLAGTRLQDARRLLAETPGIGDANISQTGHVSDHLPAEQQIQIIVIQPPL